MRAFASDNASGIIPEALEALRAANRGHAPAYGKDTLTRRAEDALLELLGMPHGTIGFVPTGTAANAMCGEILCPPWKSLLATDCAHLHVDESSAVEATGRKVIAVRQEHGQIDLDAAVELLGPADTPRRGVPAAAVSLTQLTEQGTAYPLKDVELVADFARSRGMALHVDGARLLVAAEAMQTTPAALVAHVDAVSFGATKLGTIGVEAVAFRDGRCRDELDDRRRQRGQLVSKSRYAAAQLLSLIDGDRWRSYAHRSIDQTVRLAEGIQRLGLEPSHPVEGNMLFLRLGAGIVSDLADEFGFYVVDATIGKARLVCSWDTTDQDVKSLLDGLDRRLASSR